ncbi:M28 family peptidase [Halorarius litoreus]|uniref:M28 family peptidase n=1 Tax=Halorarius litoreus TaxID=2962676 RepID=UPI0020CCBA4E|nr:M28 family peptidase [Halorarius litoreus]
MSTLPLATIGDAYTSSRCWEWFQRLTDIGSRMAGHDGEAAGVRVLEAAFADAGLRAVSVTPFDVPGWWRGTSTLTVDAMPVRTFAAAHQLVALPGSPSGEVEAPVVDAGSGTPDDLATMDVADAVVLVSSRNPPTMARPCNRTEKYARAVEAGATAFLYSNDSMVGGLPATGSVRFGGETPGPVPAVGVSHELGERLRRDAADGRQVRLVVDCRTEPATSRNVEAVVGPETGPEIVVTAHTDGHDVGEGARDNAAGAALLVEAGRLLAGSGVELPTRLRFLSTGAEELGLRGSHAWVERHGTADVVAHVNVDVIGFSRTMRTEGSPAVAAAFDEAAAELGAPVSPTGEGDPYGSVWPFWYSDQWHFATHGVPSVTCRSVGEGGRVALGWGHTHADTADKLDRRDLRDLAIQLATGLVRLAKRADQLAPEPEQAVRARIPADTAEYLRLEGRWPW